MLRTSICGAALCIALTPQPAIAQEAGEVVGYQYRCRAIIGDGSASPDGTLASLDGTLTLNEAGQTESFYAGYSSWTPRDSSFLGQRPAAVSKDATNLRWSLDWKSRYEASLQPTIPQFYDAELVLNFSSWRNQPVKLVMTAGSGSSWSQIEQPLYVFTDRWPGRPTGAQFRFKLRDAIWHASKDEKLRWTIYKAPLSAYMEFSRRRGGGEIDMKPVKAIAASFDEMMRQIEFKRANFKDRCETIPIHYDPNADIDIVTAASKP